MRRYAAFSLLALLGFLSGIAPPPSVFGPLIRSADAAPQRPRGVVNSIVIRNAGRAGIRDYPFQFGRPFMKGAIPHAPQVLLNRKPIPTQADVKNRYPDGSVEFAVIAVVIPQHAGRTATQVLSFTDSAANSNTPLTTAQMLGANFNFDATISLAFPARIVGKAMTATLAQWRAVTNGGFSLTVNGTNYAVTGLNFGGITGIPGILPVLQAGFESAGAPVVVSRAVAAGRDARLRPADRGDRFCGEPRLRDGARYRNRHLGDARLDQRDEVQRKPRRLDRNCFRPRDAERWRLHRMDERPGGADYDLR